MSRQISGSSDEAQAAVQAVLGIDAFRRAPVLARLLAYLCRRAAEPEHAGTSEYDIAFDVLDRPAAFDPATDSRVRVETHRLRKRLNAYYDEDGAGNAVRIVLPAGQYTPEFHCHAAAARAAGGDRDGFTRHPR